MIEQGDIWEGGGGSELVEGQRMGEFCLPCHRSQTSYRGKTMDTCRTNLSATRGKLEPLPRTIWFRVLPFSSSSSSTYIHYNLCHTSEHSHKSIFILQVFAFTGDISVSTMHDVLSSLASPSDAVSYQSGVSQKEEIVWARNDRISTGI